MAGGFRMWAERLRQAEEVTRREALRLTSQADGPLSHSRRLAASGEAFGGPFADHLSGVIRSLERDHLYPLADHLVRVSSGFGRLADEAEVAARLEMMGQPPPLGFDLFAALAPFRMWPAAGPPLPIDWRDFAGFRGGYVFIDTDRARSLVGLLRAGGEDLRATWRRLRQALAELCLEPPDALVALARATNDLADEVVRRVNAFVQADRRIASSARVVVPISGAKTGLARLADQPTTKAGWRAAALRQAGIDRTAWNPNKGLWANDKTVVAVWRRYGEFHLARPELQWAGMANLVGPMFYAGWQDLFCLREADRKARAKLISRLLDLPEKHPLVRAATKSLTGSELKWFEERFLIMQRKIFQDQDDMLPAYRKLDPDHLRDIIETPIAERAEPLRRLPVLEYPGG